MAIVGVRKNFTLFANGESYIANTQDFTPPKLTLKQEEIRGGGMNTPIEIPMGTEKLECEFSLSQVSLDLLNFYNVRDGQQFNLTVRELLENRDGVQSGIKHTCRGRLSEIDMGTLKAGDLVSVKFKMSLNFYELVSGNQTIIRIDPENMIHVLNGVDTLTESRNILGI